MYVSSIYSVFPLAESFPQNGARYITLTSRSGRHTLEKTRNFPALRILRYLEGLHDLSLTLEACDATSIPVMTMLIQDSTVPVMGVFLLTAILEDKPFTSTTPSPESFKRVYSAKIGALETLSQVIAIPKVDFLVCFTSISGLFGSAGQTNYAA